MDKLYEQYKQYLVDKKRFNEISHNSDRNSYLESRELESKIINFKISLLDKIGDIF